MATKRTLVEIEHYDKYAEDSLLNWLNEMGRGHSIKAIRTVEQQTEEQIRAIVRDEIAKSKAVDVTPKTEPDPGEGWRLLGKEELVVEGDELLANGKWEASSNHITNGKQAPQFCYRRRIETKPQYREPTNADIGKMVEVSDDGFNWFVNKLICVLVLDYKEKFATEWDNEYFTWSHARIRCDGGDQ